MAVRGRQGGRPAAERADDARTLSPAACRAVLDRNEVGRLAFVDQDRVHVHPVNYRVDDDGSIVFRSGRGAKLRTAERSERPVSFEIEEPAEEEWRVVIARGRMSPVLDLGGMHHLSQLGVEPWPEARSRENWIRLTVDALEGWTLPSPT